MFGHSALSERPIGTTPVSVYVVTDKIFGFAVTEAETQSAGFNRPTRRVASAIAESIIQIIAISKPVKFIFGVNTTENLTVAIQRPTVTTSALAFTTTPLTLKGGRFDATVWTTPENVLVDDTAYASVATAMTDSSPYIALKVDDWAIPQDATITGITFNVKWKCTGTTAAIMLVFLAGNTYNNGSYGITLMSGAKTGTCSVANVDQTSVFGSSGDTWAIESTLAGSWNDLTANFFTAGAVLGLQVQPKTTSQTISIQSITANITYSRPLSSYESIIDTTTIPFSTTPTQTTISAAATSWASPGSAITSDDSRATVTPGGLGSQWLRFNLSNAGIPINAVITGFAVAVERSAGNANFGAPPAYSKIQLINSTLSSPTTYGASRLILPDINETTASVGASNDTWGLNSTQLTGTWWNGSDGYLGIIHSGAGAGAAVLSIDAVSIRVWYYVAAFTSITFNIPEIISTTALLQRNRQNIFVVNEAEPILVSAKRGRTLTLPMANTEVITDVVSRTRLVNTSLNETESLSSVLNRNRASAFTLAEAIAYAIAIDKVGQKSFNLNITEVESYVAAYLRQRKVVATVTETEALSVQTLARVKQILGSIAEGETITSNVGRNRTTSFPIAESEAVTVSIGKLKAVALALAETLGYSFTAVKLKNLLANITEIESHSFGALRRTRNIAELINEVVAYASSLSRTKQIGFTDAEVLALTDAISCVRSVQSTISEVEIINAALARKKNVALTVAELDTVIINLGKAKLMAYVINQTEGNTFWMKRARNATVSINEMEALQESFNRARAYVLPIAETESFTINFARLRKQVFNITQTEGIGAALARIKRITQAIANATGYTFTLTTYTSEPSIVRVVVSWDEWSVVGDVHRLVNMSETVLMALAEGTTVTVETVSGSTVIMPQNTI